MSRKGREKKKEHLLCVRCSLKEKVTNGVRRWPSCVVGCFVDADRRKGQKNRWQGEGKKVTALAMQKVDDKEG